MDLSLLNGVNVNSVLGELTTIVGGSAGTWLCTEIVKRIKAIPINEGDVVKLRVTASIIGAVAAVVGGIASGTLDSLSLQDAIQTILTAVTIAVGAHVTHKVVSK